MSNFKLQIAFSDAELKAIYESDTRVIVAKPSKDGNDPNVAWQVFKPFQANTAVLMSESKSWFSFNKFAERLLQVENVQNIYM